jgi:hypothetical protein
MKNKLIKFVIFFTLYACDRKDNNAETFIFSNNELRQEYSMKLNSSDTVYYDYRGKSSGLFYSILNAADKQTLNSYLNKLNFKHDTIYDQNNLHNGKSFQFYQIENTKRNYIFIFGDNAPNQYYQVADFLDNLRTKQKFHRLKSNASWRELKYMIPPPPPSPEIYNSH